MLMTQNKASQAQCNQPTQPQQETVSKTGRKPHWKTLTKAQQDAPPTPHQIQHTVYRCKDGKDQRNHARKAYLRENKNARNTSKQWETHH